MAGVLFPSVSAPQQSQAPTPPQQDDSAQLEAARKERMADAQATGRSATILTDYALAMKQPNTLKPTLGA